MAEECTIQPMEPRHLPLVTEIAATAPDPWREQDLQSALLDANRVLLVALQGDALVGFACLRTLFGDGELEMLVVAPAARGKGVGGALLRHGLALLWLKGATRCLLEVRCSNIAAIALYQKTGFASLATRPALYANPTEDGLLMEITNSSFR